MAGICTGRGYCQAYPHPYPLVPVPVTLGVWPDPCLSLIGTHIVILAVHVDDCMVTGSSEKLVNVFKREMNEKYRLTDLGPAHWLLGIKITRDLDNKSISLSQLVLGSPVKKLEKKP